MKNRIESINEKASRLIATNLRKKTDVDDALPLAIELANDISAFLSTRPNVKIADVLELERKQKPRVASFSVALVELSIDSNEPGILEFACILCAASMDDQYYYHETHYTLSILHVACHSFGLSMIALFDKYRPSLSDYFRDLIDNIARRRTRGLLETMHVKQVKIDGKTRFKAIN